MQPTFYVGLDLGSSSCYQTVINADGVLERSRSIPTSEQHLRNAFADLHGDLRVHLARLGTFQLGSFVAFSARQPGRRVTSAFAFVDRQRCG